MLLLAQVGREGCRTLNNNIFDRLQGAFIENPKRCETRSGLSGTRQNTLRCNLPWYYKRYTSGHYSAAVCSHVTSSSTYVL